MDCLKPKCWPEMRSVDAFILHPLAVKIRNNSGGTPCTWECGTEIENGNDFKLVNKPAKSDERIPERELNRWIKKHGLSVHVSSHGVLNIATRDIFPVDLVCERNSRIHLVWVYYSEQRCPALWARMKCYAHVVKRVTESNYKIHPTPVVINVYGKGRIRSTLEH